MDTSALITGFDPLSISEQLYTVPTVKEELLVDTMPWVRFNAAVESGKLKVQMPSQSSIRKVKESSKTVGDALFLSEADVHVLALAFELKNAGYSPSIVTDDYSIQNVANQIGISFTSLMTFGIRYRLYWILYCPACHHKYPADYRLKKCRICGTEVKRKPLSKKPVNKKY
ncbi:MAG: NOB1 family endonuclease [Candidatus Bathyarchaeales archaeon]